MAALLELAPAGFEQVDGEGFVEFALYGAPGELPSFPRGEAEVAGVRVTISGDEVADDWAERWRDFHEPVLVGDRVWVRPPWAAPHPGGALDLVIDPAQAFGTGAHPTTRLSLELLLGLEAGGALADLGCGSGVLAIAAALLGFAPVAAFDNDRAALEATLDNARANGVELGRVERLDLRERARTLGADRDRQPRPPPAAAPGSGQPAAAGAADRLRAARGRGGRGGRRLCPPVRAAPAECRRLERPVAGR